LPATRGCGYDPRFARDRVRYGRRQSWDLVIVGGSPAMAGIDAADLADLPWHGRPLVRAFNLSIPLGTTAEVYHAIEHGIAAPPALLVYGIAITDLNDTRVEAMDPEDLMDAGDIVRWVRLGSGEAEWCIRHCLSEHVARSWSLYYYRQGIRLWAADHAERLWPGFCPDAARQARKGLENSDGLRRCLDFHPSRPVPERLRYDLKKAAGQFPCRMGPMEDYRLGRYVRYLDAIIDWCRGHDTALVLVNVPVPADLESLYPQPFDAYRAFLADLPARRGVLVLTPTREEIGLSEADFDDMIHLNGDGTARFSAWLRRALSDSPANKSHGDEPVAADPAREARGQGGAS
jgi:hypothetical protein